MEHILARGAPGFVQNQDESDASTWFGLKNIDSRDVRTRQLKIRSLVRNYVLNQRLSRVIALLSLLQPCIATNRYTLLIIPAANCARNINCEFN